MTLVSDFCCFFAYIIQNAKLILYSNLQIIATRFSGRRHEKKEKCKKKQLIQKDYGLVLFKIALINELDLEKHFCLGVLKFVTGAMCTRRFSSVFKIVFVSFIILTPCPHGRRENIVNS